MILDNRTRYRTVDLESIILLAICETDITAYARDRVLVTYSSRGFSGWCYYGAVTPPKLARGTRKPRMTLRVPDPSRVPLDAVTRIQPLDVAAFVWLVRHEVAHWRGLKHKQMSATIRYWKAWNVAGRPLPSWADGLTVAIDDAPPARTKKAAPSADDARVKRVAHARAMLEKAEKKVKTADMLVKRWTRRLGAADRAIQRAATKGSSRPSGQADKRTSGQAVTACMCGQIDPPRSVGEDGLERCIYCSCH